MTAPVAPRPHRRPLGQRFACFAVIALVLATGVSLGFAQVATPETAAATTAAPPPTAVTPPAATTPPAPPATGEKPPLAVPTGPTVTTFTAPLETDLQTLYRSLPRFGASLFRPATPPAAAPTAPAAPTEAVTGTPATHVLPATPGSTPAPTTRPGVPPPPTTGQWTAATPTARTNAPVSLNYVLGPGDVLELWVWARNNQQVHELLTISPEGQIVVPQLGRVALSGQSLGQARTTLAGGYQRFYDNPTVTLVVAEQPVLDVYVTGDAERPGRYSLPGTATVFTALYEAGGPAEMGSFRNLQLLRPGEQPRTIDLYAYLLRGQRDADVQLRSGDTVFIPALQAEAGVGGEVRRPARYELKPGETVADVLAMAGGLRPDAYGAGLALWRVANYRSRQLTQLDLAGNPADARLPLQDGDLLMAQPVLAQVANVVSVVGAVSRPGQYPVERAKTLAAALAAAQGPAPDAHTGTGVVRRLGADMHYEVLPFNVQDVLAGKAGSDLPLQPRDVIELFAQTAVEPAAVVTISGAVVKPGPYEWNSGLRASQLLLRAGGPMPGAFLEGVGLQRLLPDQRRQLITVDLLAAAGKPDADPVLQRDDIIVVPRRADVRTAPVVHIGGFVQTPGDYPRLEGMKVSDLITAAGGLKAQAGPTLQYAAGRQQGPTERVDLRLVREGDGFRVEPDPILTDDDAVAVSGNGKLRETEGLVRVEGRMEHPGSFVMKTAEGQPYTLWDALTDAGAPLPDADIDGLVVYRRMEATVDKTQQADMTRVISALNHEAAVQDDTLQLKTQDKAAALSGVVSQGIQASVLANGPTVNVVVPPDVVTVGRYVQAIPVDGARVLQTQGREGNFVLRPGDVVSIPLRSNTVMMLGAVARSGAVPFVANTRADAYVAQAGGLRDDSFFDRAVVVHTNGSVAAINRNTVIRPGDAIIVPTRHVVRTVRTEPAWESWLKTITSVATAALLRL